MDLETSGAKRNWDVPISTYIMACSDDGGEGMSASDRASLDVHAQRAQTKTKNTKQKITKGEEKQQQENNKTQNERQRRHHARSNTSHITQ